MFLTSLLRVWLTRSFHPFVFKKNNLCEPVYSDLSDPGLYVHIPFCRNLCSFCPYCKFKYDRNLAERYCDALLREIEMTAALLPGRIKAESLYFGGGSPALVAESLGKIIGRLSCCFDITGNIGLELHPADLEETVLKNLRLAGVSMVSIGVQSFNRECLAGLGREYEDLPKKINLVRKMGFPVIDIDLIFALPGQTEEILLNDLDTAFSCGATQVSTYPFIDFGFRANGLRPPSAKEKRKMLDAITAYCTKNKIRRTSVWTFALEGEGKYSSVTRENFLGFGVSAATLLKNKFHLNTFSIDAYLESLNLSKLPTALVLDFSRRQRMAYYLFWNAYELKLNADRFKRYFEQGLENCYRFELKIAELLGLLEKKHDHYALTTRGAYYFHLVEQLYTHAYISKLWQSSLQIPYPPKVVLR